MADLLVSRRFSWMRVVSERVTDLGNGEVELEVLVKPIPWHPGYWLHVARCVALMIRDLLRGQGR